MATKEKGTELLNQYQSMLSRDNFNWGGLVANATSQYWDATANQRQYADQLRGESREHDRGMQGDALRSQENVASTQAGAQKFAAQQQAASSMYGAKQSAGASKFGSSQATELGKYQADMSYKTALAQLSGQKSIAQMQGRNELDIARMGLEGTKYQANTSLRGQLAGYASNERVTGMQQSGENFRTMLSQKAETQREGMRQATAQQGNFFGLIQGLAQSPRRFQTSHVYWR
jgi:hypothetical protein